VPHCETLIRNVQIVSGTDAEPRPADLAVRDGHIERVGDLSNYSAADCINGENKILAPGFIDAHTHDDLYLIGSPQMLPKLSQGITTVIVGNCGVSGAPVTTNGELPAPMHLLGDRAAFRYRSFRAYVDAVCDTKPAVNVAGLVGHTSLRSNVMDCLDRAATANEIAVMRTQLEESLEHGALGLSTGLAYSAAKCAPIEEISKLAEDLTAFSGIYASHIRSESDGVVDALQEAIGIGRKASVPVVISHLKCAGLRNWNRSAELLSVLEAQPENQVGWDAYPYTASSTILDLSQIDERIEILITWSTPHPELSGRTLGEIAKGWGISQIASAKRLQPAGAIYHCMSADDVHAILRHPKTMIGSDGLPNDKFPHPRLWGTFPRVLGHLVREQKLFSLAEAVRKMTGLPAQRFGLKNRGLVREGYAADLVLFDADGVRDEASFTSPIRAATGIEAVWVNGVLSYSKGQASGRRAGRWLAREPRENPACSRK
jgi:N-acyl-D-amino-acid deacylase